MILAIFCVLLGLACSAPVPLVRQLGNPLKSDDGLLVLVPTVAVNSERSDGQPQKREVEYEVIAIPGEVLRREIRQIAGLYSAPNFAPAPAPAPIIDSGIIITPSPAGGSAALSSGLYSPPSSGPAPAPAKPALNFGGDAVLSTAGNILETTGNNLNSIGAATATNAGNAIQFIAEVGQGTGAAAAEVAGSGLAYAGQLSGALLRALLQVPAIKVRVIQELLRSPQPLITVISDFIAGSTDGASDVFVAGSALINEAIGIVVRMVQDTLALKGRALAAIGEAGLGVGDTAVNGAGSLIGAVIETGQNAFDVVGDGIQEVVNLGSTIDFPAKPSLPALSFPALPAPVLPQIIISDLPPIEDALAAIFPPKTPKAPKPAGGGVALPTFEQIGQEIGNVIGPLFAPKPAPAQTFNEPNVQVLYQSPNQG